MTFGVAGHRSFDGAEHRLALALGISLALHLALFATWEFRGRLAAAPFLPRWLQALLTPSPPTALAARPPKDQPLREAPLLFVEVDPAVATAEPPKDALYYSSMSSLAANPEATRDANKPKIDGQQDRIVRTFDALRPQPVPASPPPAPEVKAPPRQPERAEAQPQPEGGQTPGDLALAKPQLEPRPPAAGEAKAAAPRPAAPPRPRTLAQARMQKGILAGEKVKMDGGVKRRGVASLDVKGTTFGVYDAAMVAAVQKRWDDLLEEAKFAGDRRGKVELTFRLHYDGRVSDMKRLYSDVGDLWALYCQKAIQDPSPYEPWPADMRRMVGASYRELRFTFYY
jgi:hypothetical protein